jgi:glycosyltransferase involved in cell wall biosynthesis
LKISVVTVCFNTESTIADCLASVGAQHGVEIEHIVIDGGSTDKTLKQLAPYRHQIAHLISEKDEGIYDAMNKGLALATGELTGFLNADDMYAHPYALSKLVTGHRPEATDVVFGDVEQINSEKRVVRRFRGDRFLPERISRGVMPPHPAMYARTDIMKAIGGFDKTYRIGGDYDLIVRLFLLQKARWAYVPGTVVSMRIGGASTNGLKSYLQISRDMMRSCRTHGIKANRTAIHSRLLLKGREVVDGLIPAKFHSE